MKFQLSIITAFLVTINCNSKQASVPAPIIAVPVKATSKQYEESDTLGTLITTIEFKIKATKEELKIYDDGIIPWVNIENPDKNISRLIDADKIVLPYNKVILIIDYPLHIPASFELSADKKGFSKKQIVLEISKKYHVVYADEEITASTKTLPQNKRKGLINRNETNGKYGICCHDIGDLDLSSIEVYQTKNGKIHLILGVES